MNSDFQKKNELFVELFGSNCNRIMSFIYTLVPCSEDADDIMQETAKLLWEKFDQFEVGTNFVAWAVTIAKYQVLSHRKRYNAKVQFNTKLIEVLSDESQPLDRNDHERLNALKNCLKALSAKDQKLIHYRFEKRLTAKVLAKQIGVAMNTIYRNEARILHTLLKCVQGKLIGSVQI